MTTSRFSRVQKATALLPLALLSTAWTASLVGVGGVSTVAVASQDSTSLPDGTSVPTQAIEAPASMTQDGVIAPSVPEGQAAQVVKTASTNGIPSAALAAYQRGQAVINAADAACSIPWQLIAAIGRVESDHGRFGGNVLDDEGVARPGIYGIALDGTNNTQAIADTDAGQYDNDTVWDRAVGPMQFIPSTWSIVGVDADGDGVRNPQDVDDAALAAAVYLCSGEDDLSSEAGQRTAVFRYNHSEAYVDLVLSIMKAYQQGDFTSMPNSTTSASAFTPDMSSPVWTPATESGVINAAPLPSKTKPQAPTTPAPTPAAPQPQPGAPKPPAKPDEDQGGKDKPSGSKGPVKDVTQGVEDTVGAVTEETTKVLVTAGEALQMCTSAVPALLKPLVGPAKLQDCVNSLTGKTLEQAQASVNGIVNNLLKTLGLL